MYDLVDRPVDHLGNSGRFVLWAMRAWRLSTEYPDGLRHSLPDTFAGMGALEAFTDFCHAMSLLDTFAIERLKLGPIAWSIILEHEAICVALWREATRRDDARLVNTLRLLVAAEAVEPLAEAMKHTAAALAKAGFDLTDITPAMHKEPE